MAKGWAHHVTCANYDDLTQPHQKGCEVKEFNEGMPLFPVVESWYVIQKIGCQAFCLGKMIIPQSCVDRPCNMYTHLPRWSKLDKAKGTTSCATLSCFLVDRICLSVCWINVAWMILNWANDNWILSSHFSSFLLGGVVVSQMGMQPTNTSHV